MAEKVKKPFYKKWWVWLIAIIIIGFIAIPVEDDSASDEPKKVEGETEEKSDEKEEKSKEEEVENKKFGVGEKVELDGQIVEVTKVEKSDGNDFDKPSEGNEYVIVHVSIENKGDENITYNPFNFKMKNSDGQIVDQGMITVDSDTSLESGELAPDGNVTGTIPFEQPKGDKSLQLIFEPSFWETDQIIFNLQ
ncbi:MULTISPECIES: DUF4352 domain-containing protein [Clostridia]|uniref:DUF4352 domain-containing protein n=1 Tax=Clostridia TaxID=186801 RepID=UPI000EA3AB24|nr:MULTISPECIES: DUF4352 domain-containing protein [Clostridia]NBJ68873.1 DUF4352 domain-containing protein [Roseburia sp. 1XD42-34]RKI80247.1 DUF4352 domain-containing protein [Clostridium sp. 1xD42-85]